MKNEAQKEESVSKESPSPTFEQANKLIKAYRQGILQGNIPDLSRAITLIESSHPKHKDQARALVHALLPYSGKSIRIGITGVPGVGKSTFIERLGTLLTGKSHKVAVLAVDPSSSISKGSILGDKTRMPGLIRNPSVYVRPSPSGDNPGGVNRKTRETIILCEAAGYDVILIETVGVGQSETAVHAMTDFFLLLKLAGAGDELQGIKRGIVEMADAIVINKADGDNLQAARLAHSIFQQALHVFPLKSAGWSPPVLTASAMHNEGIEEVWQVITDFVQKLKESGEWDKKRMEQDTYWLHENLRSMLWNRFYSHPEVTKELEKQLELIKNKKITPYDAADKLIGIISEK